MTSYQRFGNWGLGIEAKGSRGKILSRRPLPLFSPSLLPNP